MKDYLIRMYRKYLEEESGLTAEEIALRIESVERRAEIGQALNGASPETQLQHFHVPASD